MELEDIKLKEVMKITESLPSRITWLQMFRAFSRSPFTYNKFAVPINP